jgi:Transglycosylase SLT domain/D-alanyl-D-alanine carboxypeptidase/Putative Flp pilus-assembly TadE/G-like
MMRREHGQASLLLIGGLAAVLIGAFVFAAVGRGMTREGDLQRAADLAALAGARAMHDTYTRLFEPVMLDHRLNPQHLDKEAYLALGREAAAATARANGFDGATVRFPDGDSFAPVRVEVVIARRFSVGEEATRLEARGIAELAPPDGGGFPEVAAGGGYDGPLAYRQGKPMRPDVALAFDRMDRAARAGGVALIINSAFRSDAEQAELWRRHPDPRWVAPPGRSLHRNGTELDLGPPAAYAWLSANAERFHFVQRYSWEAWHYGYTLNPGSSGWSGASRPGGGSGTPEGGDGERGTTMPGFVPARFAPMISRASQRWSVSAALLAAQLYAESNFNPFARSRAGALGIAQFMPGTATALGLDDPFDAERAIDAQAHLMRDLLRRFGSVPLALAAYNAGADPVAGCGCVPPYPETRAYVARILGLLSGAGEPVAGGPAAGLLVRLVR